MTDIRKLREELGSLDRLIEVHTRVLDHLLRQFDSSLPGARLQYPASLKQMQESDAAQRALHQASSRLNELCWQREIKREILRLLERENAHSAKGLSI
ncbi:MAG: hypothetical protein V7641_3693 [Blastocatellia bacterium]